MPASASVNGKSSTSNFTNIKKEMRIDHIALFSCNLETMRQFFLDHFEAESNEAVDAKTIELRDAGYKVTSGPRTTGDGYYESCILGPEGIQIEVTI